MRSSLEESGDWRFIGFGDPSWFKEGRSFLKNTEEENEHSQVFMEKE